MIRARGIGGNILFGLSRMNINRLVADDPMVIDCTELGYPGLMITIVFGETEGAIAARLRANGLVGPDTAVTDRRPS